MAVVSLSQKRPTPTHDIPTILRNLADSVEKGEVEGMDVVTTCVVLLGHSRDVVREDGSVDRFFDREQFTAGPRCDALTVAGLLAMGLSRYTAP